LAPPSWAITDTTTARTTCPPRRTVAAGTDNYLTNANTGEHYNTIDVSAHKRFAKGDELVATVMIEIDDIDLLPFSSITEEDLARTGESDLETLRRRAAHAGPIHDDTFLYRVEFHVVRQQDNTRR